MKQCPVCKLKSADTADRCYCGYVFGTGTGEERNPAGPHCEVDAVDALPKEGAGVCASCGRPAEAGYRAPLCASCRSQLAARPFPRWTKVAACLVALLLVVAMARFPSALSAAVSYERGERAEARGAYAVAVTEYNKALKRFPDSTETIARKGIAAFHAGQFDIAAAAFRTLGGREASPELVREVNQIIGQMESGSSPGR